MVKKTAFKVLLSLLVVLTAALFVYTICFKSVILIEDPAFKTLYPLKAKLDFMKNLAPDYYSFRTATISADTMSDETLLTAFLKKYSQADCIVLSPVIGYAVKCYQIKLKEIFPDTKIISIGSYSSEYFDTSLKEDKGLIELCVPEEIYFATEDDIKNYSIEADTFAVDYRYLGAVGKDRVCCVVAPDLTTSVLPLLSIPKEELPESGVLAYGCY